MPLIELKEIVYKMLYPKLSPISIKCYKNNDEKIISPTFYVFGL